MDKKQKEALVLAMLEKGESYRCIAQKGAGFAFAAPADQNRGAADWLR